MGAGRGEVLGGVKERQVNVGLSDFGCLSGLRPGSVGLGGRGARRKETYHR